jgi:hypothetical protein
MTIGISRFIPTDYTGPTSNLIPVRYFPREPTTTDKKYPVGQFVIISKNPISGIQGEIWYLSKFDSVGDAIWIKFTSGGGGAGINTVITDDGAPAVQPDLNGNINIFGSTDITVTGQGPGDTVTVTAGATLATSYVTDNGTAIPALNILNIVGDGAVDTSAVGNTITVNAGQTIPTTFTTDAGVATPSSNNLDVIGGTGINTSGAGDTITINAAATVPITFAADAGTAQAAANIITFAGSGSTTTSAAGSTVTILSSGGGISWNEVLTDTPATQMAVDMGYVTNNVARVELLLPLTAPFGSVMWVVGKGSGGWQINQNGGQTIISDGSSTTLGAAGTLTSEDDLATVYLLCTTATTTWTVIGGKDNIIYT